MKMLLERKSYASLYETSSEVEQKKEFLYYTRAHQAAVNYLPLATDLHARPEHVHFARAYRARLFLAGKI